MSKAIRNFIRNRIDRIDEGGSFFLIRNSLLILMTPVLSVMVLFVRLCRPFALIRFGELPSSRMGHFAANTEIYLCERDSGVHGRRLFDIFYINSPVCNRQLKKMWSRTICISSFARGLDLVNRVLPGGDKHKIKWVNRDRDVHGLLESTEAHISFTPEEERTGASLLEKFGIGRETPFICFHSRDAVYLDTVFPKGYGSTASWHYHDYRDSDIKNFIPAAEELTRRGYVAVRTGAIVKEKLETENPGIVDYTTGHRTDFLDIFLGAKCHFYLGDSCGFHAIPMIFRRPLAIVNMIPVEYAPTWFSRSIFIPKKLWLCKERRFLTFREILESGIGRFLDSRQYEESGIEPVENTPEEIAALAIEMEQRLKKEWRTSEDDERLQRRFWALFKPSGINKVFRSRVGAEFLRQNKEMLE